MADYDFNPFTGNFDAISVEDLSGYVPYIGATSNVDIGSYNLVTSGAITGGKVRIDSSGVDFLSSGAADLDFNNYAVDKGFGFYFNNGISQELILDIDPASSLANFKDLSILTTNSIEGASFRVSATSDFTITQSSDVITFTNPNSNKNIVFNVNRGGTPGNLLELDATNGLFRVNGLPGASYGPQGLFNIGGSQSAISLTGGLAMNPTVTGATYWVANIVQPTINSNAIALAFYLNPTFGATNNQTIETIRTVGPAHKAGYNDNISVLTEQGFNRSVFAVSADSSTITYRQVLLGGAISLGDIGVAAPAVTEEIITLTGGATRVFGTNGSITQKGIWFKGYGTQSGLIGGTDSSYALLADGGVFSMKYDYNGTTNALLFGAGEDAAIGYNGTDFVIDTALVGTGTLDLASQSATAITTETLSEYVTIKIGGVSKKIAIVA